MPNSRLDTIILGDVELTRVYEKQVLRLPRAQVFPDVDPELWRTHRDRLVPEFFDPEQDQLIAAVQTWVLRSAGRTILVDTGVGNGKDRPGMPPFHQLDTDFLGNLERAGVRPAEVDLVVITHVHGDHVGWNTRLVNGEWVPTFPNAQYLISRADFDYWNPRNGHATRSGPRMAGVFADSVEPVHRAGQTVLWTGQYAVDEHLSLQPAPGHTPGSAVLTLHSGTDRAVFVGDLLHSPLQLAEPDQSPCFDEAASRATRRRVLADTAQRGALLVPAHFPGAGAAEVRSEGSGYTVKAWAAFS